MIVWKEYPVPGGDVKKFRQVRTHWANMCRDIVKLICDLCPREHDVELDTFPTIMSLKQHKWGLHSKGYTAYCGKLCKWSSERRKHQKKCVTCLDIKQKRDNKEENPHKPKAHPQRKKQKAATKNEDKENQENQDQNDERKSDDVTWTMS